MDRIETLRAWLATHADDRFAAYSLALELDKVGRHEDALVEMRALLERHPASGAGHYQHGRILAARGRTAEARAAWEAGLSALRGVPDAEARRSVREIEGALADLDQD